MSRFSLILLLRFLHGTALALALIGSSVAAPANPDADLAEAQRLLQAGKPADALRRIDDALKTRPVDTEWRFLRGVALSDLQRPNEAIKVYGRLIEERPELPEPRNNLAVLYAQQGQFDKARVTFEGAIRTSPVYAAAFDNLGDVQARLASASYAQALQVTDAASAPPPSLTLVRDLSPHAPKVLVAQASPAPARIAPPPAASAVVVSVPAAAASTAKAAAGAAKPAASAASMAASKPVVVASAASSPPLKPVVPAASAAASSPPLPASEGGPTQAQAAARLRDAVVMWADAWSRKDLDAYFAAYAPGYGGGKSAAEWKQDRRARIMGKSQIEVTVSGMVVEVEGERAKVRFRQSYRSDKLSVESNKTLLFSRVGGKWLIARESAGS